MPEAIWAKDLPAKISVGACTYEVCATVEAWERMLQLEKTSGEEVWAHTSHRRQQITLDPNTHRHVTQMSLLHEVFHCVIFAGGDMLDGKRLSEEAWVAKAAAAFLPVLQNNPQLVAFLSDRGE